MCRTGAFGFYGQRRSDVQGIKRQIIPVTSQIAHRSVAKIPPAIPFRSGNIDRMERPRAAPGPSHRSQSSPGGTGVGHFGPVRQMKTMSLLRVAASSLCSPHARFTQTCTSRTGPMTPALDQFFHAAVIVRSREPGFPICVASFSFDAVSRTSRASQML